MSGVMGTILGMMGRGGDSADCLTVHQAQEAGALIVDIRQPAEWKHTGVLAGARLITFQNLENFLVDLRPHLKPGQTLALICASGARTAQAKRLLAGKIANPVADIRGGMMGAMRAGSAITPPTRKAGCKVC